MSHDYTSVTENTSNPEVMAAKATQEKPVRPSPANMPAFYFHGYILRPAAAEHLWLAAGWNAADPDHCHTTKPEFWLEQGITVNNFLLEDQIGPVFFFKLVQKAGDIGEIHIQFSPNESTETRLRSMSGLTVGWRWLEDCLFRNGFRLVYFNSKSPQLIHFCQKRLGFVWDGRRLERAVTGGNNG